MYRLLKKYTCGAPRRIIEVVRDDNGWEAWRQLQQNCEPALLMRSGQALKEFALLAGKKAKNIKESRQLLASMDEKAKVAEELTKKRIDENQREIDDKLFPKEFLHNTTDGNQRDIDEQTVSKKVFA